MEHTNSQRGPDGRFGASDGPKSKRIEVWLQPQTVALLDTLTKQWGVGRGKVIDQLLTRGPVPPESWTSVTEQPPSTPSAPPEPTPEPAPTTSGQANSFFTDEFQAMQEKMTQQWDIAKADANVIGCKPERVQRFKAEHKLDVTRPLSVDAQQLLRDELERDQRSANGEANALQARLQRLKERATPNRLQLIRDTLKHRAAMTLAQPAAAKAFLLEALEDVGIKRRSKLVNGVWADLERLIPNGEPFDYDTHTEEDLNTCTRCLFWGTAIRLATLDGEPPQNIARFLDWCGYAVHQSEQQRRTDQWWSDFGRTMTGKPSTTSDRNVLDLPIEGELTAQAIKAAYKAAAKKAHPDLGGTAELMTRINEAKERLMLEVAA